MPPGAYERYRKRLEQQLRADVGRRRAAVRGGPREAPARRDLGRAPGFEPSRATLDRLLGELEVRGVLGIVEQGSGAQSQRHRKLTPPTAER